MSEHYEPFDNAEQLWFWFCSCIITRGEGLRARQDYKGKKRSIETVDVHRIIKKMKSSKQINNRILRVMSKWGEIGYPPTYCKQARNSEVKMWEYGISCLDYYLKTMGVL